VEFEAEGREWGGGSWKGGSKLEGLGSAVSSPSPPRPLWSTKSSENVSSGRKCHLVSFSIRRDPWMPLAEPLSSAQPRLKTLLYIVCCFSCSDFEDTVFVAVSVNRVVTV